MNTNFVRVTIAAGIIVAIVALGLFWYRGSSVKAAGNPSDIAVDETVAYHDFHSCRLPDGSRAYDFHFGGADRSRRAQFIARHDNMGRRTMLVVTNDRVLPKGHIRLIVETALAKNLEGHNFGTAWSRETLLINPRRPIERAVNIPPCGPERQ